MINFKVNKSDTEYNNGNTWEVVDIRTDEVIRTCARGGDAAAFVRYYEADLIEAAKIFKD